MSELLFEQMGEAYNPGTRFLYYIVLAFGALCIINYLLEKRFDDNTDGDDDDDTKEEDVDSDDGEDVD